MSVIYRRKPNAERNKNLYGYTRQSQSYFMKPYCTEIQACEVYYQHKNNGKGEEPEIDCMTLPEPTQYIRFGMESVKKPNHTRTVLDLIRKVTYKGKETRQLKNETENERIILNTRVESLRKATIEKHKEIQLNEGEKERIMLSSTVGSLRKDTIEKEQEIQKLKNEAEKERVILNTKIESLRKATIEKEKEIQLLKNEAEKERVMLYATVESIRKEKDEEIKKLELDKKDVKAKYDKLLLKYADTQSDMWKMKKVAERNCKRYQRSTTSSDIETLKKDLEFEKAKKEKNKKAHDSSHRRIKTITSTFKCLEDQSEEYDISTGADSSLSDEYPVSPDESEYSRHVVKRKKTSASEFASKSVVNVTHVTAREVNFINHSKVELESAPDMDERLPAIED